jgi:hypothetical protein
VFEIINTMKNRKYHTVGRVLKSNRKTRDTILSEEFQNLTEKQELHTVGTVPKSNRKTRYTTLSEQFQNLTEKQEIPYCRNSSNI